MLFAVAWLNLTLQPCAMALEGGAKCPDCPPAAEDGRISHGTSHARSGAEAPCAAAGLDCGFAGQYSHDGRGGHAKPKDSPAAASFAVVESHFVLPAAVRTALPSPARRAGAASPWPPLSILYCVYLK